ncbi:MAG: BrnA antitoxin family protein [Oligoflexia bacterium]|nr:BrnA antitoxin family protein [Oligoflexia bacterium]
MRSTKKTKRGKIQYGKTDLLDDEAFNPKETKFRVSMFIDLDVLEVVRERAKAKGLPYQTYINQYLRETHLGSEEEDRIRRIVREELSKKAG